VLILICCVVVGQLVGYPGLEYVYLVKHTWCDICSIFNVSSTCELKLLSVLVSSSTWMYCLHAALATHLLIYLFTV
jgi:hypothetical protein